MQIRTSTQSLRPDAGPRPNNGKIISRAFLVKGEERGR